MKYKYGFIIKKAEDYLRNIDFSYLDFIHPQHFRDFKLECDGGIVYIEAEPNHDTIDNFVNLLEKNNIEVEIVSCVKWKKFPNKPYVFK